MTWLLTACSDEVKTINPTVTSLTESVYASVTVNPVDMYDAYANGQGIIEHITVEENQQVPKGQVLARIKASQWETATDNAQLSLELAKANYSGKASLVESIQNELDAAQEQAALDSIQYFRQKALWEQQIGTENQVDQLRVKYQLTLNRIASLKQKIQQTERELKKGVQQAENNLRQARVQDSDYVIKAKMDSRIYSVLKEEGELISPQQPIMTLGHPDEFIIEMNIDEVDIVSVQKGQKVIITLDAYKGKSFEAHVEKIYPQKDIRTQTFLVEALFDEKPDKLYPGLTGEANIIIGEEEDILTIPLTYLKDGNKVVTPDGEIEVKVGRKNYERVEILEGIDQQTDLIKP